MTAVASPLAVAVPADRAEIYRRRYLIAFAVTLASVLELVDTSIVNVAIPHMMGNLGATLDEIAWVSTGYIVANVIILPLTSWLADRFGRRRYYTGSIILFTVASFFCGNATTLGGLVAWRVVQGVGGGALLSTAQAILFDVFPAHERAKGQAIFGMGVMVGPTLGPTLGGWITDNYSWPWIFYVNIPLGILAAILTAQYVPEPSVRVERSRHVDWLGLALLVIGIGSLQTMLERGEAKDWFDATEVRVEALLAAVSLAWFIWHEWTVANPVVNLRILKDPQVAAGTLFASALGFGLYAGVFALPVYAQNILGFTAWDTGKILLPGAISSAFMMAMMGRLVPRFDARELILFGAVVFLISMQMHSHFTTQTGTEDMFWPIVLRGIGIGCIFVPLTGATVANLRPQDIPQGTGLFNLSRQLGGSVGIAISATLVTRFTAQARANLVTHVRNGDATLQPILDGLQRTFQARGATAAQAMQQAYSVLDRRVTAQAAMVAYEKIFYIMGFTLFLACGLLLFFRTGRARGGGGMAH